MPLSTTAWTAAPSTATVDDGESAKFLQKSGFLSDTNYQRSLFTAPHNDKKRLFASPQSLSIEPQ